MTRTLALLFVVSAAASGQTITSDPVRGETIRSATIDADGNLAIVRSTGATIVVRKEGEQRSFSPPVVSPAKGALGAQAMFPNCCTSYDLPLQLIVYTAGKVHRFQGIGLPIFQWRFSNDGTRVAYGQEPVHFGCAAHYELRDIVSERLLDSADIPQPCGQIPNPEPVKVPQWVADLLAKQ